MDQYFKDLKFCAFLALAIGFSCSEAIAAEGPDFALRDGDTVVFLGDSITAARAYGKIIENFTLLRFPQRKIRFYNAGRGGDTAAGGLARLDQDVFSRKPTVLIVAYGINDIGWGLKGDAEHKQKYLDSVRGIVQACQERKVRVFICSAAVTAADPATSEDSFLQKMCDEGMAIARELGERSIDVQRTMRGIQQRIAEFNQNRAAKESKDKDKDAEIISLHVKDGVHLSDLGQVAMAYAILKGLDAPSEVSTVHIDARGKKVVEARDCEVKELSVEGDRIRFLRHDQGLPFNQGLFFTFNYRFVPVPDEMNRYMIRIEHLPEGRYELTADGRGVGTYTAQQFTAGVNIASATSDGWQPGGPWDAQAAVLKEITEARHNLFVSDVLGRAYLGTNPLVADMHGDLAAIDERLIDLQRKVVQPHPYRFEIHRSEKVARK
jgi:lysophospholipase L1-like esterase